MWEYLVAFSTWAENNSGQIQILIAFVALFFAFQGYRKVLEQIKISNRQENIANNQREFELRYNLLNSIVVNIEKNHEILLENPKLLKKFKDFIAKLKLLNDKDALHLEKLLVTLNEAGLKVEDSNNALEEMLMKLMSSEHFYTKEQMESHLKILISTLSYSNTAKFQMEAMHDDFEVLKEEKNIK